MWHRVSGCSSAKRSRGAKTLQLDGQGPLFGKNSVCAQTCQRPKEGCQRSSAEENSLCGVCWLGELSNATRQKHLLANQNVKCQQAKTHGRRSVCLSEDGREDSEEDGGIVMVLRLILLKMKDLLR